MGTAKHTQGKWHRHHDNPLIVVNNSGLVQICKMLDDGSNEDRCMFICYNEAIANADYIVKACNNFSKLVDAINECIPDLEHYVSTHGVGPDKRLEKLESLLAELKEDKS